MLLHELPAHQGQEITVVVEVPKGSGSKFKYDPATGFFTLHRSLPRGLLFPLDYGFIPSTLGEDGDPLDAVLLADTALFCGCVGTGRLIGLIQGTQKKERGGGRVRNDILFAVHRESAVWRGVKSLRDLPAVFLDEVEFFFTSYRNFQGKEFRPQARLGPGAAKKLLKEGIARGREPKR